MTNPSRPRYTDLALPPYSYVPGHAPHPVSDPAGHMHGETHRAALPLLPDSWEASTEYRYGIDLFNCGFYWEAHEAWESLWHAAGRKGRVAEFLKGLIKLAAAGVKAREGNPRGVRRHAARAAALFSHESGTVFCGTDVDQLIALAGQLSGAAETYQQPQPKFTLDWKIRLSQ
jgi:hypothetical protein